MIFHADYASDGTVERIHLNGGDFDQEATFSLELLTQSDSRFLRYDESEGIITIQVAEGTARYRVVGAGEYPRTLVARRMQWMWLASLPGTHPDSLMNGGQRN